MRIQKIGNRYNKTTSFEAIKVNKETFKIIEQAKNWKFYNEPNPYSLSQVFHFDSNLYNLKSVNDKADKIKKQFFDSAVEIILNMKEKKEAELWSEILRRKSSINRDYKKQATGYGPNMIKEFKKKRLEYLKENLVIPGKGNENLDYRTMPKSKLLTLHLKFVENFIKTAKPRSKEKIKKVLAPILAERKYLSRKLKTNQRKLDRLDFES